MMFTGRSFSGRERNCFFLNMGGTPAAQGRFANTSAVSGLDFPDDGRAVALVDWDHDGDLDMWISNRNAPRLRLMRNELPAGNHFLMLRLQGNGKTTNRDAIGARVEVLYADTTSKNPHPKSIKTLRAGEGFLAQSSKWLHFGLGKTDTIKMVTVRWPGGEVEQFTGINANCRYRLIQGSGVAQDITQSPRKTCLVPSTQNVPPASQVARITLVELLPMPPSPFTDFSGKNHIVKSQPERLLLMNLWASWCPPCQTELNEFSQRYDELQAKGIDVLALSVDGLGDAPSTKADAEQLVSTSQFPFPVGFANERLIASFQELHDFQLPLHRDLPLPTSFLIDRQGRLAVIYKGPVTVDQLLNDVDHSKGNRIKRFTQAAAISGQPILHPRVEQTAMGFAAVLRFRRALNLQKSGRIALAAAEYEDVIQLKPDSYTAHNNLGVAKQKQGKLTEAADHYRQSLRLKPDFAEAHNSLGVIVHGQGKVADAIEHFHQAIKNKSDYAEAHNNLGATLHGQGETLQAIEQYHHAIRITPDYADADKNLNLSLRALVASELAQRPLPNKVTSKNALMHATLGEAYRVSKKFDPAIRHFTWALAINPDIPSVLNNLAWIRATHPNAKLRNGTQAVELAERCCKLSNYQLGATLDTLAAAYAEAGQYDTAIKWQKKLIELTPPANKGEMQTRLKLYQAGNPYRDRTSQ